MKLIKKVITIGLSSMMFLTGCSGGTTKENGAANNEVVATGEIYEENGLPKDQKVVLKLGVQEAGYGIEHYEYVINSFEEKFPNVTIELTSSPEIGTLISTMAQAGNNEDMFDIFTGYTPYAAAGMLEPMNDLLDRTLYDSPDKKLSDSFYLNTKEMIYEEEDSTICKLPKAMYIGGLFYNKDLFEEKGWNQNPKNWDEFISLCETIKQDGVTPLTFSGLYNYLGFSVWWHKAFELAEQNGELEALKDDFINYKGKRYNNQYMIETYEKVYELGQKGYFASGLSALNHTQSQMQVLQGKVAMVSTADWVENEMKKEGATPEGYRWGYMAMPMVKESGDTIFINSGDSDSLVIWKEKPELNKKWAKEFILWTYNLDNQKATAELASALPVRADFYESEENKAELNSSQKAIFEYISINNVVLETNFYRRPIVGPSDAQADKLYVEGVPQVAEGKLDPKELLDKAQKYFEQGLEEAKKLNK